VSAVPTALEGVEVAVESAEQLGLGAGAALQLAVVVEVRLVTGEPEEFAVAEVREAGEVGGAQGEPELPAFPQLPRELEPAVFGKLVGGDVLRVQVRAQRHGLRRRRRDRPAAAHEILRDMTTGWVLPHGLQVVADLGVADALHAEPRGHTFMTDTHCDVPSGLPT